MGEYYIKKKDVEMKAISHFEMALSIYEKRLPIDHQDLIDIRSKLCYLKKTTTVTDVCKNTQKPYSTDIIL